jgi:hypothetical protein
VQSLTVALTLASVQDAAYVFELVNESWIQTAKLIADDGDIEGRVRLGVVRWTESRALVGAPNRRRQREFQRVGLHL